MKTRKSEKIMCGILCVCVEGGGGWNDKDGNKCPGWTAEREKEQ